MFPLIFSHVQVRPYLQSEILRVYSTVSGRRQQRTYFPRVSHCVVPLHAPSTMWAGKFQASTISVFQWTGLAACKPYLVTFLEQRRSLWMWRDKSQEPYVQVGRRERIRGRRWAVQRSRRRRGLELETGKPESVEKISQGTTLVSLTNGESQLPCVYHTARSSASPSLGTPSPLPVTAESSFWRSA